MKTETNKILKYVIIVLMMTFYVKTTVAFPLPTADLKRIAQTAKMVKNQVDMVKADVEHVRSVVTQIQQGGFASGAAILFAEASSGRYDRYGTMFSDMKGNAQIMGASLKSSVAKKEKREELQKEIAQMETERKLKKEKESKKILDIQQGKISETEKNKLGKKIYSFVRNYGDDTARLITSGSELAKTGSVKELAGEAPDFVEDFAKVVEKSEIDKKISDKIAEKKAKKAKEKIVFEVPDISEEIPLDTFDSNVQ